MNYCTYWIHLLCLRIILRNIVGKSPVVRLKIGVIVYNNRMENKRPIKCPVILRNRVERDFLPHVRHPSRYIGGEINQIRKDLSACDIRIALCFPDIYEVAMSYTGLAILYEVLNGLEGVAAERAFAPWIDAEPILRDKKIPLFTLESMAAVRDFDLVGFSLTNELCYTNLLNMLDLAGIPIRSKDRTESDPIVVVGGQSANCAEPIAEFVDLFVLGDGEEAAVDLVNCLRRCRNQQLGRADFLSTAAQELPFVYVPSLYRVEYDGEAIRSIEPTIPGLGRAKDQRHSRRSGCLRGAAAADRAVCRGGSRPNRDRGDAGLSRSMPFLPGEFLPQTHSASKPATDRRTGQGPVRGDGLRHHRPAEFVHGRLSAA